MPVIIDRLDLVDTAPGPAGAATDGAPGAGDATTAASPPTPTAPHVDVMEKIRCAAQRATRVFAD